MIKAYKKLTGKNNGFEYYEIGIEKGGQSVVRELRPAIGKSAANRRMKALQADIERDAYKHL